MMEDINIWEEAEDYEDDNCCREGLCLCCGRPQICRRMSKHLCFDCGDDLYAGWGCRWHSEEALDD